MTERHEGSFAEGQEETHDEESHHEGTFAEGQTPAEEHPEDAPKGDFAKGQADEEGHEHDEGSFAGGSEEES